MAKPIKIKTTFIAILLLLSTIIFAASLFSACTFGSVKCKVVFYSNGGSAVENQYVSKGSALEIPEVYKKGYTLEGWFTSGDGGKTFDEKWSFLNNKANKDFSLYAKWNKWGRGHLLLIKYNSQ